MKYNSFSGSCPLPVTPRDTMWTDKDVGRAATTYNHWYHMDTQGGQSGSPVWRTVGADEYIVSVHTTGDDGSGIFEPESLTFKDVSVD